MPYAAEDPLPAVCLDADAEPATSPAGALDCEGVTAVTVDLGDLDDEGFTQGDVTGLTWLGNTGNDEIEGGNGSQTIDGGDGDDSLYGRDGADVLRGGGADNLEGDEGAGDVDGGAGEDLLFESPDAAADVMRGGGGADYLFAIADTATDTYDGGDGIDGVLYASGDTAPLFIDLSAGKAGTGTEADSIDGRTSTR